MFLHMPLYIAFLIVVCGTYWGVHRLVPTKRWHLYFLLLTSYIFCATFDVQFVVILFLLTLFTYFLGAAISKDRYSNVWLGLGLLLNLGILGVFKYANFFVQSLIQVFQPANTSSVSPALALLLPIGISFYTFQSISYLVEIHRKKLVPATSFVDLALYLAFFPKLIAGPLIRPNQFFRQTALAPTRVTQDNLVFALTLLISGLAKKVLIADTLASLSNTAFRAAMSPQYQGFPTLLYWQGFYLFAFQIYADFSGYTDLARASAMLFGFTLPENFNQPYLSITIGEFWNKWHISVTEWFREYLYFPIARKLLTTMQGRNAVVVQIVTSLLTMTLIGLWHGEAWTFVVWGFWHGVLISVERVLKITSNAPNKWQRVIGWLATFHLVGVGWIFFRSDTLEGATHFFAGLTNFSALSQVSIFMPIVVVVAMLTFALDVLMKPSAHPSRFHQILLVASLVVVISLWLINFSIGSDLRPFIYGRF